MDIYSKLKKIKSPLMIVVVGPTAVGKTNICIELAKKLNTEIINADSKQFYRLMNIGTAKPTFEEQHSIRHHLIGFLEINEQYNAGKFANQAFEIVNNILRFQKHVIVTGGSGMYVNALCFGLDSFPLIDLQIREELNIKFQRHGIEALLKELLIKDPNYYQEVDKKNHRRIIRALEICRASNKPYSSYFTQNNFKHNNISSQPDDISERHHSNSFNFVIIGLRRNKEDLYNRINQRVDIMIEHGLIEEAKSLYTHKKFNSLNAIGYKELFQYFDGNISLNRAIELIKQNSRRYAKRQITWFKKIKDVFWIDLL